LRQFISELLRFGNPPWKSEIDDAHEPYDQRIWRDNPGTMIYEQCLSSAERVFAYQMRKSFWQRLLRK